MERKPRKQTKHLDFMKPISMEIFGTNDDPCFGKHYSTKASECNMCGDSEACFIMMSQKQNVKRAEIESKESFKDLEETFFNSTELEKYILKKLKKYNTLLLTKVYSMVNNRYNSLKQVSKKEVKSAVIKVAKSSKSISIFKKEGIRSIKLK